MCAANVFANYDSAGFAVQPPWWAGSVWHRDGRSADTTYDAAMCRQTAYSHMDWLAVKERLYMKNTTQVPGHWALVRNDVNTGDPHRLLAIVRSKYEPFQNSELFDLAEIVCGESGARYEAAGSLKRGKVVWILAQLPTEDAIAGDKVARYLLVTNRHGTGKLSIVNTTVRVVCWNTLSSALADDKKYSFRHTKNIRDKVQDCRRALLAGEAQYHKEIAHFNHQAGQKISPWYRQAFLKALFPGDRQESKRNTIEGICTDTDGLFTVGERTSAIDGTAFGLYNAVTQYTDHQAKVRKNAEGRTRLSEIWGGAGSQLKQRADALLTETQEYYTTECSEKSLIDLVDGVACDPALLEITVAPRN